MSLFYEPEAVHGSRRYHHARFCLVVEQAGILFHMRLMYLIRDYGVDFGYDQPPPEHLLPHLYNDIGTNDNTPYYTRGLLRCMCFDCEEYRNGGDDSF